MARVKRKRVRFLRKVSRRTGKGIKAALKLERLARNPLKFSADQVGDRMISWGSKPNRTGIIRERFQSYNPRTDRWIKFDSRRNRIMGSKRMPYRNIRRK